jgi:two-component system, NarL family, response regulator NreC
MVKIMPRVLIVDDHTFIRRGIQSILDSSPGWDYCGEAENGIAAIRMAAELKPDIIVMDVSMPGLNGLEATRVIHEAQPEIKIVLVTLHDSVEILRSGFQAGAQGYLLKSEAEQELLRALRSITDGNNVYVSPKIDGSEAQGVLREISVSR